LLAVWAPLAATFLLVTGSTPVINASINRLPGRIQEVDLAAFAVLLNCVIVLHSPLFVTREIAIKLSVDRSGSRRALLFCLGAAASIALLEILLGATSLGARFASAFTDRADVVAGAHRGFLWVWPAPILIAVRGVYQAHQIRVDDTLFVGLGTLFRLIFTAVFGLAVAPGLGLDGATLGALCLVVGLALETVFSFLRARARARPPERSDARSPSPLRFGLPLMFANFLGVAASLFYLRIAGLVPSQLQEDSLAAFQEVRPLHWMFAAGAVALQSLTTAKAHGPHDEQRMLRFAAGVGGVLTVGLAVCVLTPLRYTILVDWLGEREGGTVLSLTEPVLLLVVFMPFLNALRFTYRGVLISRGHTRAITFSNMITLILLASAISFDLLPTRVNGAFNAYAVWIGTLLVELAILAWTASRRRGEPGPLPPPVRTPREAAAG
jgi:Na+-driven multidrug efflux pump